VALFLNSPHPDPLPIEWGEGNFANANFNFIFDGNGRPISAKKLLAGGGEFCILFAH
jgi:hypothetical protein